MTRLQFISLLVPAMGSFVLVILAWLHSNSRLVDLKQFMLAQFDSMSKRMDNTDKRIDRMEQRLDHRLEMIEGDQKQFFTITGRLDGRIDQLSKK